MERPRDHLVSPSHFTDEVNEVESGSGICPSYPSRIKNSGFWRLAIFTKSLSWLYNLWLLNLGGGHLEDIVTALSVFPVWPLTQLVLSLVSERTANAKRDDPFPFLLFYPRCSEQSTGAMWSLNTYVRNEGINVYTDQVQTFTIGLWSDAPAGSFPWQSWVTAYTRVCREIPYPLGAGQGWESHWIL